MKQIEIDRCNPNCSHLVMRDFNSVFCYHPKWHLTTNRRRRIPYSRLNDKHKFPVWCPLPDVEEETKYTLRQAWIAGFNDSSFSYSHGFLQQSDEGFEDWFNKLEGGKDDTDNH